ncbi:HD domain-containing protein [Salipaludibacillus agaradhaerens]|jgi:putative nucleotidyltransferase with HDIG domain|uniref:HD-GYP domain-containing protein n=2 Tax=Salipaludibacillus agaradhaerens TaxID=76935 RepID=UPI00215119EC|nr:HD-GYP domain-containing protein [Salipaludibacillus agaradhaerens]MCR6107853.1 HD domain-containing protein [Salipaludibacillus agaradhaerens]MCR6119882.1 HD domain-containing protein [Salipaludibacillus agaradhaerens]UJW58928.1 HD domain-containing protein [Bacillus sp. A116_S68]
MKLMPLDKITHEARLAEPIYNEEGKTLLNRGMLLSENVVERLKEKGVTFVYIEDEVTADLYPEELLTPHERQQMLTTIHKNFNDISNKMSEGATVNMDEFSQSFSKVIKEILEKVAANNEAISLLTNVISFDSSIFQHSLNVSVLSLALGKKLKLNMYELYELGLGALLHDIGKLGIPADILNKTDSLSDDEYEIMKTHTIIGFDMIRKCGTLPLLAAHCAYQHHEKGDGSGYPRQLTANEIHLYAKIISIADVFDAVTSNRVYRKALLPHEGLELLFSGANSVFDQQLVELFAKTVVIYPIGLEVQLSDGRVGIVAKTHAHLPSRPVVRVVTDSTQYDLDLSKELGVTISACEQPLIG